jgi:hypothetical protein
MVPGARTSRYLFGDGQLPATHNRRIPRGRVSFRAFPSVYSIILSPSTLQIEPILHERPHLSWGRAGIRCGLKQRRTRSECRAAGLCTLGPPTRTHHRPGPPSPTHHRPGMHKVHNSLIWPDYPVLYLHVASLADASEDDRGQGPWPAEFGVDLVPLGEEPGGRRAIGRRVEPGLERAVAGVRGSGQESPASSARRRQSAAVLRAMPHLWASWRCFALNFHFRRTSGGGSHGSCAWIVARRPRSLLHRRLCGQGTLGPALSSAATRSRAPLGQAPRTTPARGGRRAPNGWPTMGRCAHCLCWSASLGCRTSSKYGAASIWPAALGGTLASGRPSPRGEAVCGLGGNRTILVLTNFY